MVKSIALSLLLVSSCALYGMEQENKQSLFSRLTSNVQSIVPAILNNIQTLNLGKAESTPIIKKETNTLRPYSGIQFLMRLIANVQTTNFFKAGDEINYTIHKLMICELINNHSSKVASITNALINALDALPRRKFIITKDVHAEKNKTVRCEYRDCLPKFKFDESLGYATVVTPIRCIQFYTILDHKKNIFSPELPVDEYNVDVDYGCTENVFHLNIVKKNNSISNPGFKAHRDRIETYTKTINPKSASIENLLILHRY